MNSLTKLGFAVEKTLAVLLLLSMVFGQYALVFAEIEGETIPPVEEVVNEPDTLGDAPVSNEETATDEETPPPVPADESFKEETEESSLAPATFAAVVPLSTISGFKFDDVDADGVWDASEAGLPGWTIELLDTDSEVVGSDVTDTTGQYSFDVAPGIFTVREVAQSGYIQTAPADHTCFFNVEEDPVLDQNEGAKFAAAPHGYICNFGNHQIEVPDDTMGQCIGENLLANGSFENPDVVDGAGWDIFTSGTSGLAWVVSWVSAFVGAPSVANIEFHGGVNGWLAEDGSQYAELDSDWAGPTSNQAGEQASSRISQTVPTILGGTYQLTFDFSARPNYGTSENRAGVYIDGVLTDTVSANGTALSNTSWTEHSYSFIADTSTEIALADAGTPNSVGSFVDNVSLCLIERPVVPQCAPELNGGWADHVVGTPSQGDRKDGSDVLGSRSDATDALDASDWEPGDTDGFYSLGFGGSIVVSFDSFVPDIAGNDISIHEATNGAFPAGYPEEKALIEVSQNGTNWFAVGTATNLVAADRVSYFDVASTGLSWIKFVRITDTSDTALYAQYPDADGFDLDAVDATQTVCDEPEDHEHDTATLYGYKWNDLNNNGVEDEGEPKLSGWTITATVGTTTYVDVTDAQGAYSLEVPAGSVGSVDETAQAGWLQTYPLESGVCNFEVGEGAEFFCKFGNYHLPTQTTCDAEVNLLGNGSFEAPAVGEALWDVFPSELDGLVWTVAWLDTTGAPEVPLLELQSGRTPADGLQFAELDSDFYGPPGGPYSGEHTSVKISQAVSTIPGYLYKLSFQFSALPYSASSDNAVAVRLGGVQQGAPVTSDGSLSPDTVWSTYTYNYVATGSTTEVSLADAGLTNSFGTLVDDVAFTCLGANQGDGPEGSGDNPNPDNTDNGGGGGGGGGGSRISLSGGGGSSQGGNNNSSDGEVLGDSDHKSVPEVAGAQTAILPTGAPNTGFGGTSDAATTTALEIIAFMSFLLMLGGIVVLRRMDA